MLRSPHAYVVFCLLAVLCFSITPPLRGDGDELALSNATSEIDREVLQGRLELLIEKRDKFARNFGEGHPTLLRLSEQIRDARTKLKSAPASDDPLDQIDESAIEELDPKQLRQLVSVLVQRVRVLDGTVAKLDQAVEELRKRP